MKYIGLAVVLFGLGGCAGLSSPSSGTDAYLDAFCKVAKPLTMAVVDTDATRTEIDNFNNTGRKLCGWVIPKG